MTEQIDRRADTTRLQILNAASRQFAYKPYSQVSLDDILSDAAVTKGAMYFHFRSKHALALAIVERCAELGQATIAELLARKLSALETLIDISYLLAVQDIGDVMTRAGRNLLGSIGHTDGLQARFVDDWISVFTDIGRRACEEGDVIEGADAREIAKLLVSMHLGIRQTSDLDTPERLLGDLGRAWAMVLPGFANPERLGYLCQFVRRRTVVAVKNARPIRVGIL
jgi:AcrR family transcriptional regulator